MGGARATIVFSVSLLAFSLLAGCQAPPRKDLFENQEYYRSPNYVTKLPTDRGVTVLPLVDDRKPTPVDASTATVLMADGFWSRPVPTMVDDVLRDEVTRSKVFREVLPTPRADTLLLKPYLVDAHGGVVEESSGRWTFAQIAIRVEVHGPADGNGNRRRIHDKTYTDRQVGARAMRPISPMILTGMALNRVVGAILADIDQQNLARSAVPLAPLDDK